MNDRARGALLGMAVGDALGTTYEFERMEHAPYPELATGPATDVVGRGPFDLPPGAITDDTQLAVCLARSLVECGALDAEDVGRRYVAWMSEAFDIGNQTRWSLDRIAAGEPAATAGIATWTASGRRAAGNGSLMRTAPIGVAYAQRGLDALVTAAIDDSLITHADPRCALACAAFDAAIAAAITTGDPAAMLPAAERGLQRGVEDLRGRWSQPEDLEHVERAAVDIAADLAVAHEATPGVDREAHHLYRSGGFVRVALRLAVWHLAQTASWRDALVDVASRGGDADTNAAIVGALLGARDGAAAIPASWIERVLGATQPGSAAWAEAHHPRHLLALAA